jgi:3-isopropylmalate dehydrogenase
MPTVHLKITVLAGDGIGPEVIEQAVRILRAVAGLHGYDFHFRSALLGGVAIRQTGVPLPPETREACLASDAVLLGAVGGPEFDNLPSDRRPEAGLLGLRRALGGFANLRPATCYHALVDCSPLRAEAVRGADILVVRELLGGIYFGEPRGFAADRSEAFNTMRYSVPEIERIARVAFQQAQARRRKLTSADKANVLETSQLWRETVTRVGCEFPGVALEHMLVDSCAMRLVTNPSHFDVILAENLFGDILSDEAAVISGSLGMLASASIGGRVGLFEPVHGSAPDIAGRGIANPLGAILTAALLLRFAAGREQEARDIENAVRQVLDQGHRTADLARSPGAKPATTAEMGALVEQALAGAAQRRPAHQTV